jgi:nucleoside-diphosphate-sugar epimerase
MATDASAATLFCFGLGYSAGRLAECLAATGWRIAGTAQRDERLAELRQTGIAAWRLDELPEAALADATHVLVSIPPAESGDLVLHNCGAALAAARRLRWIGYLSTTGVYGDHGGGWVDETTPVTPTLARTARRARAEADWLAFGHERGVATQVFRLAGIYGPGRSVLDDIRAGRAQCIERPGQWFSRIHVDDIVQVLRAAMTEKCAFEIFNVCDDEPAAPADVVRFGCALLGVPPPPAIPFERAGLSEMAKSFWADNKRVRNERIKSALGVKLLYPTYREGLGSLTRSSAGS